MFIVCDLTKRAQCSRVLLRSQHRRGESASFKACLTGQLLIVRFLIIVTQTKRKPDTSTETDRQATLKLLIALARAYQVLERGVRPYLAQRGLGMTEFAVLEVLYHKGTLPLGEIRDRILVTGASTTYVIKKLEERGLVRRKDCAEDHRVVFGELTPKGRALIQEVFPIHVQQLCGLMEGLSLSQKQEAIRLLRLLGHHARCATGEPVTEED